MMMRERTKEVGEERSHKSNIWYERQKGWEIESGEDNVSFVEKDIVFSPSISLKILEDVIEVLRHHNSLGHSCHTRMVGKI